MHVKTDTKSSSRTCSAILSSPASHRYSLERGFDPPILTSTRDKIFLNHVLQIMEHNPSFYCEKVDLYSESGRRFWGISGEVV